MWIVFDDNGQRGWFVFYTGLEKALDFDFDWRFDKRDYIEPSDIFQPKLNRHRQPCPQTTVVCTLSADTLQTRTLKFKNADTSQTQTFYYFKNVDTEQTHTFKYFKSADTQQTQAHISSD